MLGLIPWYFLSSCTHIRWVLSFLGLQIHFHMFHIETEFPGFMSQTLQKSVKQLPCYISAWIQMILFFMKIFFHKHCKGQLGKLHVVFPHALQMALFMKISFHKQNSWNIEKFHATVCFAFNSQTGIDPVSTFKILK